MLSPITTRARLALSVITILAVVVQARNGSSPSVSARAAVRIPHATTPHTLTHTLTGTSTPTPTLTPVPVALLSNTPAYGTNGPVAFSFSRHVYHPGELVTAAMHLTTRQCILLHCYKGTTWSAAGAPLNHCRASALNCTWKVALTTPLYQWQSAQLSITTTLGQVQASDFFAVIPRFASALETRIIDPSGAPYGSVPIQLRGPISATLTTDPNGFAIGLLPNGRYQVRVAPLAPATTRWFRPQSQSVTVHTDTQARIIGYNHLQVLSSTQSVPANAMSVMTMTVRASNALGQPYPGLAIQVQSSGPAAVLCSLSSPPYGYVEPQLGANASPLYLPVAQATDGSGSRPFEVFTGSKPGALRFTFQDAALSPHDPWLSRLTTTATIHVQPVHWATFFPAHVTAKLFDSRGHGTRAVLSWSQLIWQALHGKTVPFAIKQASGLTIVSTNPTDGVSSQKALLRFLASFVPLQGLEIGPVVAGAPNNWGVALFVHQQLNHTQETHVLDAATLASIEAASTPVGLPSLPTLAQWSAALVSPVQADYAVPIVDSGLTYYGLPYLPRQDATNTAFETYCQQPAFGS